MRSEATPAAAKAQQQPQKRSLGGTFEGSENRVALNRLVNHDESWLPLNPVANHHVPFQKVSCTGYTIHHFQTKLSIFCRKTLESTFSTWKILQITKNEDTSIDNFKTWKVGVVFPAGRLLGMCFVPPKGHVVQFFFSFIQLQADPLHPGNPKGTFYDWSHCSIQAPHNIKVTFGPICRPKVKFLP